MVRLNAVAAIAAAMGLLVASPVLANDDDEEDDSLTDDLTDEVSTSDATPGSAQVLWIDCRLYGFPSTPSCTV